MDFTPEEDALITHAYCGMPLTPSLVSTLDLNTTPQTHLILAAYIARHTHWQNIPNALKPRLQGLLAHAQAESATRAAALTPILHTLNAASIPVMLLKGAALRYHYLPDIPRRTADTDIAVPPELFAKAICELQLAGIRRVHDKTSYHETFKTRFGPVELHRWTLKARTDEKTQLWRRAIPTTLGKEPVLVPSSADLICQIATHLTGDLFEAKSENRKAQIALDILSLLKPFSPKLFLSLIDDRAKELSVQNPVFYLLTAIGDNLPKLLNPRTCRQCIHPAKNYREWLEAGRTHAETTRAWRDLHYKKDGKLDFQRLKDALPHHLSAWRMRAIEREAPYSFLDYINEETQATPERSALKAILERL